jgi:siroheme synthase-like protein
VDPQPVTEVMMKEFPIFLSLAGRPVLVVGATAMALAKARLLVQAGARVTIQAAQAIRNC